MEFDKKSILIVDDDSFIIEILTLSLEELGFNVCSVTNQTDCFELFESRAKSDRFAPFDLVIVDLNLNGQLSGDQLFLKLKKSDPNLKGILSSGLSSAPAIKHFKDFGFKSVLLKPYRFEILQKIVFEALREDYPSKRGNDNLNVVPSP